MKKLLSAFILLSALNSNAQLFDWQMATYSGTFIELFKKIAVLKDESVTTAFASGYRDITPDRAYEIENYIDCANGASVKFNPQYYNHAVISNIAKNGTINWKQELFARGQSYFEILHISSDEKLNCYILIGSYEMPQVNNYDLIYIPSGNLFYPVYSEEEAVDIALTYGIDISRYCNYCMQRTDHKINFDRSALGNHWLVKIDAKGKIRWIKNSTENLDDLLSHVSCFENSGDGSFYVITEDDSKPDFQKEIKKRKVKRQYLLAKFDTCLHTNWSTKIISSSEKGNYHSIPADPLLTLDENNNIITYFNYDEYIIIEDKEYTSKKRKEGKNKDIEGGSLIAVFDSTGKLKSAINSKSAFYLGDLAVKNNKIYLPITNIHRNRILKEKIDTSGLLQSVLICVDYHGKLVWKKMEYNVRYKNIEVSDKEEIYLITGPAKNRSRKKDHSEFHTPLFGASHSKNADDFYIFMYDKTGEEIKMKTITKYGQWESCFRFDFRVINEHYSLMFGEANFGCVKELKDYNNNFKKGKGCDSIGFWCKLKL